MPRRRARPLARLVLLALVAVAAGAPVQGQQLPEAGSAWTDKAPVESRHAMVVAAHPLAAAAGQRILRQGGSAVDAAVAVQLVLGLVEPQSSGLGGGAFMLHHDARTGRLIVYDGRETAPAAARPDRFLDASRRPRDFFTVLDSGRAVGVPGAVRLLAEAHRRHGRLPWPALFAPAIELAEQGFAITPRLHGLLRQEKPFRQARIRDYFFDAAGRPRAVGSVLRNPAYARTLRRIAAEGADAFYTGPIADDIVGTVADAGRGDSDLTRADLARYRVVVRAPVCARYRAYRVCGAPAPTTGGYTALQILRLLEPYDVASMGPMTFWSTHFFSEAGKLAYADRVFVADPAFAPLTVNLLDDAYLRERSLRIRATAAIAGRAQPGDPPRVAREVAWVDGHAAEQPSTSHVSIVDRLGNAVSMTTSVEYAFGSRLMTAGGFILNNQLTDFAFEPVDGGKPVANRVEGGKRPRSAMSPTIVYDASGRLYMIVGAPGGSAIINYVAKTLLGVLDWKLDPQKAIDLPNVGSRNGPTELERGTASVELAPRLRALGHEVVVMEHPSGLHAIVRSSRGWIGGADPRREGVALGD